MPSFGNFKVRNTVRARELRLAATPTERLLWQFISRSQLGVKFSHQMPVGPYFADFLCRELMLIVELDGFSHDVQPQRDHQRDSYLKQVGYQVLHFPNAEVMGNVDAVIAAICLALGQGPTPNPSRKRRGPL
jgi:BirA family biotin operon repressor/biotin-[acetyl-CoA-carboxylase] ligase